MTTLHVLDPNPGGGPAVLLLHGLGATGISWGLQFPALMKESYRPLAPDMPGFGDSPYDGRGWNIRRTAAQVAEVLQERKTGPAHVVGLSMGGVTAQQFALDFPHMTRKLVLASTFTVLRPDSLSNWFYFLRRAAAILFSGMQTQAKVVAERVFPEPEQAALRDMVAAIIAKADERAYRGAMLSLAAFDSRRWLHQISCPTLVITGAKDTTVSPALQKQLASRIPGSRQIVIEGAGHAACIDRADEFNRVLLEFLG